MTTRAPAPDGPLVGIVVTDSYPAQDPDRDTAPLLAALHALGVRAEAVVWHDVTVDWASYALLLLRSPWDYPERLAELDTWLTTVAEATTVLNDPALVRWNLDKRYLDQLARLGVAVVPTTYRHALAQVRDDLSSAGPDARVVLKPTVSAGARDTGLFRADDPAALVLAERILASGAQVMVQPEVPELSAGREKAVYVIDGRCTHAIAKGALLADGGGLRGGVYVENPVLVPVSAAEEAFAAQVLAAVGRATGLAAPVYARIDLVDSAAFGPVLLEAELFEPALNLHVAPAVTQVVAEAVVARLGASRVV